MAQQSRAEHGVASVPPFAAGHAYAHTVAVAVDVAHLQSADFGHAQACGVHGLQQHAAHRVRAGRKQARDLFARQQLRPLDGHFGKRHLKVLAFVSQHHLEQELHGACSLVHAAVRELLVLDHAQQVLLHFLHRVQRRVAPVVLGHSADGADVGFLGPRTEAALHHRVEHALT